MMRVSVVIPSYNVGGFLPQALASVRAQTRPVHEVIVVDDGSSDDSAAVAARLGATVLRTPSNAGPSAARNAGVRVASGEVVAFLDGDDYWEPEHVAETVGLLERHPEAVLAFGGVRNFGAAVGVRRRHPETPLGAPADVFLPMIEDNMVAQSAAVARRAALLEAGGYDETMRFSEDYDLWLRMAMRAPFVAAPGVTANYRVHSGQATQAMARLVRGCWTARGYARTRVAASRPAAERARMDAVLRRAWEADLRWAWRMCDRAVLEVVLAQHAVVPDSEALHARWVKRTRRYWSLWVPAVAVWDQLPQPTKNILKVPVRALRQTARPTRAQPAR